MKVRMQKAFAVMMDIYGAFVVVAKLPLLLLLPLPLPCLSSCIVLLRLLIVTPNATKHMHHPCTQGLLLGFKMIIELAKTAIYRCLTHGRAFQGLQFAE